MKITIKLLVSVWLLSVTIACSSKKNNYQLTKNYQPDDAELYHKIVALDSAFFSAYNTCETNLETYASFYDENIEFYHDNGGYINSKTEIGSINTVEPELEISCTKPLI